MAKGGFGRFGLRGLFVAVALLAIALAVLMARAREQRRTVVALHEVFGRPVYDFQYAAPHDVDIVSRQSRLPAWMLETFGIDTFHTVVGYVLDAPAVDDEALTHLHRLPQLQILHLSTSSTTTRGIDELARNCPTLRVLDLNCAGVDDQCLAWLARLPHLEELWVSDAPLTDAGISQLAERKGLRRVVLFKTRVTEAGITKLRGELPDCDIDD